MIVIVPLCMVGLAATTFMAVRYKSNDITYNQFVSRDNAMAVELARADRNLVASAYGAYQSLSYQSDDAAMQAALDRYKENSVLVVERLTAVENNLPETAPVIDPMIVRAKSIVKMTDDAVANGAKGWITDAKRSLADADAQIVSLSNDIAGLSDRFKTQIALKSSELSQRTNTTITASLSVLGALFGIGIFGALFVASRGITARSTA